MHEDDIIFFANQGDSSMEDKDFKAYGEIEYSEEVVCSTALFFIYSLLSEKRKVHQDDFNSLKSIWL